MSTFRIRNNSVRTYGFAGRMCIAGAGCTTPVEVAKATTFRFEPLFDMTEEEMFKSWRGVAATMKILTPNGKPSIEVLIDGGPKAGLSVDDLVQWSDEYRTKLGWTQPTTSADHAAEVERSMARPEDPLEVAVRNRQEEHDRKLVAMVMQAVRGHDVPPPMRPARGRNDEKPEK